MLGTIPKGIKTSGRIRRNQCVISCTACLSACLSTGGSTFRPASVIASPPRSPLGRYVKPASRSLAKRSDMVLRDSVHDDSSAYWVCDAFASARNCRDLHVIGMRDETFLIDRRGIVIASNLRPPVARHCHRRTGWFDFLRRDWAWSCSGRRGGTARRRVGGGIRFLSHAARTGWGYHRRLFLPWFQTHCSLAPDWQW